MTGWQRRIFAEAEAHDGQYLLLRRFKRPKPWVAKNDVDRDYEACEALVNGGYAHWIGHSNLAPGIRLTGKPLPDPPAVGP